METVIRLSALCLTGALLAVLLKRTNPDMALLLALAVCGAVLLLLAEPLQEIRDFSRSCRTGAACRWSCSRRW